MRLWGPILVLVGFLASGMGPALAVADNPIDAGNSSADDQDLASAFGNLRYSMSDCRYGARRVRIDINFVNANYINLDNSIKELMRRAITFAWQSCPLQAHVSGDSYMVDGASAFLPDGFEAYQVMQLVKSMHDVGLVNPVAPAPQTITYQWQNIFNYYGARLEAEKERLEVEQRAKSDLAWDQFWQHAWLWAKGLVVLALFCVWLVHRQHSPT